jgi:copper chaperone NosL
MVSRLRTTAVFAASLLLVGFTSQGKPVEIMTEADECRTCTMAITDVPLSAEVILKDRTVSKFDDIGCMVTYWKQKRLRDDQVQGAWVHDLATRKWLPVEKATFAKSTYPTPMRSGIVAFAGPEGVKKLDPKYKATIVTWSSLVKGK